jgi:hypothetical protein
MRRFWKSLRLVAACAPSLAIGFLSEDVRAEEGYQVTNEVVLIDVRVSPAKGKIGRRLCSSWKIGALNEFRSEG